MSAVLQPLPSAVPRQELRLSTDAVFLNRVLNDPSVFPWIAMGHTEPVDVTPLLERDGTVFLRTDFGGFLYTHLGDWIYEVHTQFLPEGRSGVARLMRESFQYMFTRTPALAISSFAAHDNEPAQRLAKLARVPIVGPDTLCGVPGNAYLLTLKEWVCQQFQQS